MHKLTLDELRTLQAARPAPRMPVVVLLENIRSMYNVGSFFRTADGAGAQSLILTGFTAHPPRKEISKVALGAEETVPWEHVRDPLDAARQIKARGFSLIAIERADGAHNLYEFEFPFPCCVVFGHEVDGVSEELLGQCDHSVEVPMLGAKESLNVATCAGVVLYEIRRRFELGHGASP